MECEEFTFPSADGKTAIHAVEWTPEGPVRAVLQISHGVSEYCLRYEPLAAYLTARGFAVVSHDHLGHGASVAPGAPRIFFGPKGSWDTVVRDLYTRRLLAGKRFPKTPYFLLGHSMGSFLARTYLADYPGTVDGAILMGTGQMSPALLAGGKLVARREGRRVGRENASPVVEKLAFGTYNRLFAPNRTPFDWLSVNRDNVDRYLKDPMCGENPTIGLFEELLAAMARLQKRETLHPMNIHTPIFFVSGSMDPVGDCGKGVQRAFYSFQKAGVRDVQIKLYPGLRHEILNEDCRELIFSDLYRWMNAYLPAEEIARQL